MTLWLVAKDHRIRCTLVIEVPWKDNAFEQLEAQKGAIERETGESLVWFKRSPLTDREH